MPSPSSPPWNAQITESQVSNVFAASSLSIAISGLFFLGRLASKRIQRQAANASDYVLVLSLCCCWGMAIVDMWMTNVGLGRHLEWVKQEDPSLSQVKQLLKVFIADEVFYDLGIASVKISILLLYQSLFIGDRSFLITSNVLMGVVAAWLVGNLLPSIFSCRPISGFWTLDPNAVCINKTVLYVCGSTINIATDIAILCLPLSKVLKLHLNWRRKLELAVVFLLGSFVCVVSIYRFTMLFASDSPDLTWSFASVLNWSSVELAVAIASACLPLMRPLLLRVCPRSWPTAASSSTIQDSRLPPITGLTTIGGTSPAVVLAQQRGRRVGAGHTPYRARDDSDFARLSDDSATTDSDHDEALQVYDSRKFGADLEHGFGGLADGIVVTKTFEITSVDGEVSGPDARTNASINTNTALVTPRRSESSFESSPRRDSRSDSPPQKQRRWQQQ